MPDLFVSPSVQQDAKPADTTEPIVNTAEPALTEAELADVTQPISVQTTQPSPMHFFTAFKEMPARVCFQTQEANEIILLFLRKSFITNIPWIFSAILFSLIPILFIYAIQISLAPLSSLPPNDAMVLIIFYYIVLATIVFINFITWYFNVMLITTERVIEVNFTDLVYKNIAETKITLVQDVSYTQVGVIRAVFDYGDVLIQTAGALDNFDFKAVPRPAQVVQIIESLIGKEKEANAPLS